jgi:hypothetical protein
MVLISTSVSSFLNSGGGITSSGSSEVIRCHASLSSKLFRTKAAISSFSLNASASTSSRNFALRDFSEGPWQKKHLLERIGLMSRLNDISAEKAFWENGDKQINEKMVMKLKDSLNIIKKNGLSKGLQQVNK